MTVARTHVCLCVDDFALDPAIDRAALRLHDIERIHAIACMVGSPRWEESGRGLKSLNPGRVDLGLHLDFTEMPLAPGPGSSLSRLILASMFGRLDPAAVRAQVGAQFGAFERVLGRAPDFVDGHQHVHQLPVIGEAVLAEIAVRYRGARRPWVRSTRSADHGPHAGKARIIEMLGAKRFLARARALGLRSNERLLGVHAFRADPPVYRGLLERWLDQARDADLLMCHPAVTRVPRDPIAEARMVEFGVLESPGFGAMLAAHRISLAPMSRILSNRAMAA